MKQFKDHENFLLIGHINADGDTVGSTCALALALKNAGKRAVVAFPGKVPARLSYISELTGAVLPGDAALEAEFDCAIAVDCATEERMGELAPLFFACEERLVIDHHPTNTQFGQENIVRPTAATAQIILSLLCESGYEITPDIANCLYSALISDCGNFCHENTDADVFETAAFLAKAGADVPALARRLFGVRSLATAKVNAFVLQNMKLYADGRIAAAAITEEDIARLGAEKEHCEEAVQELKSIEGVEIAIMIRSAGGTGAKGSLRAVKGRDVSAIAAQFGGGGHVLAAGCFLDGKTPEEAMEAVVEAAVRSL